MKQQTHLQYVAIVLTLGVFVGCASYPVEKKYRQEAVVGLTVPMVQVDAQKYTGKVVIWGGTTVKVVNDSSGSRLTIMETPLDADGYPLNTAYSRGRFIAYSSMFLDPEIYRKGRKVTLAGEITGVTTQKLGEGTYNYPQVMVNELRYWQPNTDYYYPYYSPYYWPGWYGEFDDGYIFDFHGQHDRGRHEGERRGGHRR
jgi:outer membrane lipoprotein